ncbi:MAG: NADH-quinone oxidoreductase subunit K [Thermomicrobiales bacterium]|nr:NADH-quinone oxidoreductase subunit K [Thermomicrobiales bacterium]
MTLVFSLAIASLFAAGAYLMLKRDLIRLIAGMIMIGNAANLFIMASALRRGTAAILPHDGDDMADPLTQAMVLTAIVISFATAALALVVVYRVYTSHLSVDLGELSLAEEEQSELDEPRSEDIVETEIEEEVEAMIDEALAEVPT